MAFHLSRQSPLVAALPPTAPPPPTYTHAQGPKAREIIAAQPPQTGWYLTEENASQKSKVLADELLSYVKSHDSDSSGYPEIKAIVARVIGFKPNLTSVEKKLQDKALSGAFNTLGAQIAAHARRDYDLRVDKTHWPRFFEHSIDRNQQKAFHNAAGWIVTALLTTPGVNRKTVLEPLLNGLITNGIGGPDNDLQHELLGITENYPAIRFYIARVSATLRDQQDGRVTQLANEILKIIAANPQEQNAAQAIEAAADKIVSRTPNIFGQAAKTEAKDLFLLWAVEQLGAGYALKAPNQQSNFALIARIANTVGLIKTPQGLNPPSLASIFLQRIPSPLTNILSTRGANKTQAETNWAPFLNLLTPKVRQDYLRYAAGSD